MKILHLASWYPNRLDHFTGDFIQRHALAAAITNEILIIHVVKTNKPFFTGSVFEEIKQTNNLTEHIIYYRHKTSLGVLGKIVSFYRYLNLYRKTILKYKRENGIEKLVHVHVPLHAGPLALWLKYKYGFSYVLTEHYGIYNDIVEDSFSRKNFIFRRLVKKIIKESSVFLPVSKYLGEAINKIVVAKPYTVIYNTVNTNFFRLQTEKEPAKLFRFIHVSGMEELKNVDGIINAAESLSKKRNDFQLWIVGKSDPRIQDLAREKKLLDKVVFFTGEIKYQAVAQEMQRAKSLILFSRIENMPCVILEALCCGLPVIATKVGGIPEVINDENGMLVDSENEGQLQNAMSDMIDGYKKFNREAIAIGAAKKFSYETIGARITHVYGPYLNANN